MSGTGILAVIAYDNLGNRTSLTRPDGRATTYGYDLVSRPTSLAYDFSGTANDVAFTLTYNSANQIVTRATSNDRFAWAGAIAGTSNYTVNGLNQYTTAAALAPTYDPRDNLSSLGGQTFSSSVENQIILAGTTNRLYYDALQRLVMTSTPVNRLEEEDQDIVAEYDNSDALTRRYVFGPGVDEPLIWYEGTGTTDRRFLYADERGSIVGIADATGALLSANTYDEYGVPGTGNVGRFQYTGQAWIPELQMYYYKARIYTPVLGRFMSVDPLGYGQGPNLYAYVNNDPINLTDPSGLKARCAGVGDTLTCSDDGMPNASLAIALYSGARRAIGRIAAAAVTRPQKSPPCSLGQKAGQWLGNNIAKLGALGTNVGLGTTAAGVVTTGAGIGIGATGNLPLGLGTGFVGLGLIDIGATVTTYSGLVTATGATISAVSGSGKSAAVELASRLSTQIIPSGPIKDFALEAISRGLNAVVPEIQSCTR